MGTIKEKGWNPYLAGILSGIVLVLSVWITGNFFGVSTSFVNSVGMIEKLFDADLSVFLNISPRIDWQWMFVVGILIGSFIASTTSSSFRCKSLPDMWKVRFGPNRIKRGLVAFIGGTISMFGARLAEGWTSGHGLSGSLQLAISGFIALICFFIGGIITARILYSGGNHKC